MPRGIPGSFTHGASAYQRNACRCKAICTPEHARIRKLQRQITDNLGGQRKITVENNVAQLTPTETRVLEAFLRDGADTETVARRIGISHRTAGRHITSIFRALGLASRTELLVALHRGQVGYRTVRSKSQRRDAAA